MGERITVDLDKIAVPHENPALASILYSQIREIVKKAAVPDSPAAPPDDRLDVIFGFAELMGWGPDCVKRGARMEETDYISCSRGALFRDWLSSPDAGEAAAAYCWRKSWKINWGASNLTLSAEASTYTWRAIAMIDTSGVTDAALLHEKLVRAVLAAAKAEKERG